MTAAIGIVMVAVAAGMIVLAVLARLTPGADEQNVTVVAGRRNPHEDMAAFGRELLEAVAPTIGKPMLFSYSPVEGTWELSIGEYPTEDECALARRAARGIEGGATDGSLDRP